MTQNTPDDYFRSRTFSQVVDEGFNSKPGRRIFGSFLYENTNTYLFSRTNTGKSMLAFQIGLAAATGSSFDNCIALRNESEPMKVLIADLENDPAIISNRHAIAKTNFDPRLLENLVYLHENPVVKPVFSYEMLDKIYKIALEHKAKLIILDNISRIMPFLLKAEDVARVIEFMKRIRQTIGASFLIIGHTTKMDARIAITPQSYYGSSSLQNFFPEIFFLDTAKDGKFFLCQAKTKHKEHYIETVPVLTRGSHPLAGVGFTFEKMMTTSEIQLPYSHPSEPRLKKRDLNIFFKEILILANKNVSCQVIAEIFNVDRRSIYRILEASRLISYSHS